MGAAGVVQGHGRSAPLAPRGFVPGSSERAPNRETRGWETPHCLPYRGLFPRGAAPAVALRRPPGAARARLPSFHHPPRPGRGRWQAAGAGRGYPARRPGPRRAPARPPLPFRRRAVGPRPVSRLLCCSRPFFPGLAGLALGSAGLGGRREEEEGGRERAGGRAEGGGEERAEPVRRGPGARTRGETAQRLPAGPAPRRRRRRRRVSRNPRPGVRGAARGGGAARGAEKLGELRGPRGRGSADRAWRGRERAAERSGARAHTPGRLGARRGRRLGGLCPARSWRRRAWWRAGRSASRERPGPQRRPRAGWPAARASSSAPPGARTSPPGQQVGAGSWGRGAAHGRPSARRPFVGEERKSGEQLHESPLLGRDPAARPMAGGSRGWSERRVKGLAFLIGSLCPLREGGQSVHVLNGKQEGVAQSVCPWPPPRG